MSKFKGWPSLLNQWELRPFEILKYLKKDSGIVMIFTYLQDVDRVLWNSYLTLL